DINAIANLLSPAKTIAIQQFKNKITYSPQFNQIQPYTSSFLKEMKQILEGKIERILIRE
ncbi:MAG: hypothetical protein PHV06_05420, partial [bacterium]|nr:hypothetical protein [bacterium]